MAKKRAQDDEQGRRGAPPRPETLPPMPVPSQPSPTLPAEESRLRLVIEGIRPLVEDGRFPAKAAVGDMVIVEADVFAEGHDVILSELRYHRLGERRWMTEPMDQLVNDRWRAGFLASELGAYRFAVRADIDRFATWRRDLEARLGAGQDVSVDLIVGARLLRETSARASSTDGTYLIDIGRRLDAAAGLVAGGSIPIEPDLLEVIRSGRLADLARLYRATGSSVSSKVCSVQVEPERARFGSWYELFPRSASPDSSRPGTLLDVIDRLSYVERLGADVLYLPPIHPIGQTSRKGRNGVAVAGPEDPGSPWAIGSPDGGHTAIDPQLGTLEDFDRLVAAAMDRDIAIALDMAFQCSPDHPWVSEHPEWFLHRPDGSIRFAENPPKRYEDIYPLDFETGAWQELWQALLDVIKFWIGHGVTIFRVDNPHTKPFGFWEWLIASVKADHPEVIFLSEAFTRPKIMQRLAKVGFSQSYTYFAWRQSKWEIESYLTELTQSSVADYLRPNFWPNTPDILTESLQTGGTSRFVTRLVLAATLAASYGIYGPVFELQEHLGRGDGSEEYANSEKYSVRHWDLDSPLSLADLVARVNSIRKEHPALQRNDTLRFHVTDNEQLLAYSKTQNVVNRRWTPASRVEQEGNVVLTVINLDSERTQSGWVHLDLDALGLTDGVPFAVHDLLTNAYYQWQGASNFVALDPAAVPAHIFSIRPTALKDPKGRLA
jgi:starch synthase (maltosyl-transferring)